MTDETALVLARLDVLEAKLDSLLRSPQAAAMPTVDNSPNALPRKVLAALMRLPASMPLDVRRNIRNEVTALWLEEKPEEEIIRLIEGGVDRAKVDELIAGTDV